jgi:hypothetical protein
MIVPELEISRFGILVSSLVRITWHSFHRASHNRTQPSKLKLEPSRSEVMNAANRKERSLRDRGFSWSYVGLVP